MPTETATLRDRIAPIAAELGRGWSIENDLVRAGRGATLVGPDGERVLVSVDTWRKANAGRLFLTGSFPNELTGHLYGSRVARISVDGAKPAALIAKDIKRRLLPAYREALAVARKRKADEDALDARRDVVMAEVVAAMGDGANAWRPDKASAGLRCFGDAVSAEVEVTTYQERAEFTITVPWALAPTVARLVGELRDGANAEPRCDHDPAALMTVEMSVCECGAYVDPDTGRELHVAAV